MFPVNSSLQNVKALTALKTIEAKRSTVSDRRPVFIGPFLERLPFIFDRKPPGTTHCATG
jgi:hypothetical protein